MAADAIGSGPVLLPKPGTMVSMSPSFEAPTLRGIKVHAQDPLRFEFVLDQGDSKFPTAALKDESTKLVKYFLASVTTPAGDLWVNLSPYEKDRIVAQSFGQTEMGRDLLAQDYILKQLTASIIYPESKTGKEFWSRVYAQAAKRFGTTRVPINTFNKVWIVPQAADVYENAANGTAYVSHASLKVLLESDYLALHKAQKPQGRADSQKLGTDIVREVVIPLLTKEVNSGRNFAPIRQVYHALILATWYKRKLKDSVISLGYADQNKTAGIDFSDDQTKEKIYLQYLEAFKAGAYNYIKEEADPLTKKLIPRKYFSGGASFAMVGREMKVRPDSAMTTAQLAAIGRRTLSLVQVVLNNIGSIPLNGKMDRIRSIKRRDVLKAAATGAAVLALAATQTGDTPIKASLPEYVSMTSTDARLVSEIHKLVYGTGDAKERTLKLLQLVYRDETREAIIRVRESLRKAYAALGKDPNAVVVTANFDAQDITPKPFDLKTAEEERRVLEAKLGTLLKTPGLAIDQQSKDGVLELRLLMLSLESLLATVEPKDLFKVYDDLTATKPYPLVGRNAVKIKIDRADTPEKMAATVLEGVKPLNGTPVIYLVRPDIAASIAKALPSTSQRIEIAGQREQKTLAFVKMPKFSRALVLEIVSMAQQTSLNLGNRETIREILSSKEVLKQLEEYEESMRVFERAIKERPEATIVFPVSERSEIFTHLITQKNNWILSERISTALFVDVNGSFPREVPKEDQERVKLSTRLFRAIMCSPWGYVLNDSPGIFRGRYHHQLVVPQKSNEDLAKALKDALAAYDIEVRKQIGDKEGAPKYVVLLPNGIVDATVAAIENDAQGVAFIYSTKQDKAMITQGISRRDFLVAGIAGSVLEEASAQRIEIAGTKVKPGIVVVGSLTFSEAVRKKIVPLLITADKSRFKQKFWEALIEMKGNQELASFELSIDSFIEALKRNPEIRQVIFPVGVENPNNFNPKRAQERWLLIEKIVRDNFAASNFKVEEEEKLLKLSIKMARGLAMTPWEFMYMTDTITMERLVPKAVIVPANSRATEVYSLISQYNQRERFWVGDREAVINKGTISPDSVRFLSEIAYASTTVAGFTEARNKYAGQISKLESELAKVFPEDVPMVRKRIDLYEEIAKLSEARAENMIDLLMPYLTGSDKVAIFSPAAFVAKAGAILKEKIDPAIGIEVIDNAMKSKELPTSNDEEQVSYGGIDLNTIALNISNSGQNIRLNMNPELLENTRNAAGLVPVVINILPLSNLKDFLQR